MNLLRVLLGRFHSLGARRRELGLDEEIRAHLDLLANDYRRSGLSHEMAREEWLRRLDAFRRVASVRVFSCSAGTPHACRNATIGSTFIARRAGK